MTANDLIKELKAIIKVHPEAKDAHLIAVDHDGERIHITYVGYDKHGKRIKLEE